MRSKKPDISVIYHKCIDSGYKYQDRANLIDFCLKLYGEWNMKIVITGSNGQLGKELIKRLDPSTNKLFPIDLHNYDITEKDAISTFLNRVKPEMIMHCAAYTDVDGCEKEPNKAYLINVSGTMNLVDYAKENDSTFLYVSTDYVFDGTKASIYNEHDDANPISIYGRTKLDGENIVRRHIKKHFIVRTAWLYGEGKNFVSKIIEIAKKNRQISVVADQFGSPTYAKDLAVAIARLIYTGHYGTYNIVNFGGCSRHRFAVEILKLAGIDTDAIPVSTSQLKTIAARPANSVLSTKAIEELGIVMRRWQDALSEYISTNPMY